MDKGFTLLELLIVVGILMLFLVLGYVNFSRFKSKQDLINTTNQLYSDIQWVRQKSMGSIHSYGIRFLSGGYDIFEDLNDNFQYDTNDRIIKSERFKSFSFSNCTEVLFSRRGISNNQCTIKITNRHGISKEISVSQFKVRIK